MTSGDPQEQDTLSHDPNDLNDSDSAPLPESKSSNESMKQDLDDRHSLQLGKSPASGGFLSRSSSYAGSELSEMSQYVRSITNKYSDLGSQDSLASYHSDQELSQAPKRRSSFDHSPRQKLPQTKMYASDLIGLDFKNVSYHLTERQKVMVQPVYKTERPRDHPRRATFAEKLAATQRIVTSAIATHPSFDVPGVDPDQIRSMYYYGWAREEEEERQASEASSSQTTGWHKRDPSFVDQVKELLEQGDGVAADREQFRAYTPSSEDGDEDRPTSSEDSHHSDKVSENASNDEQNSRHALTMDSASDDSKSFNSSAEQ
ncbi:hypothetical protein BJV82DRAFT_673194 [Fennellomyces sp. T-0311]|nr:hypothetical protein BJV82DRAFT_673194 [Fennellomyces sp. T-0311]